MLAVVIIGILSFLAIPRFSVVKQRTDATVKVNDIRVLTSMVDIYAMSNGQYPGFWISTALPSDAVDYLPINWTNNSYTWWILTLGNNTYAIIWNLNLTTRQSLLIDRALDDGNLASGIVTIAGNSTLVYRFR